MGTNLSDTCYRELLFEGLTEREKAELVKAQTLRTKHIVGESVMVNYDDQDTYYLVEITRVTEDVKTIDVKYAEPYDDTEMGVSVEQVRSIGQTLAKARALRDLRMASWEELMRRVSRNIGPQPNLLARGETTDCYTPMNKPWSLAVTTHANVPRRVIAMAREAGSEEATTVGRNVKARRTPAKANLTRANTDITPPF